MDPDPKTMYSTMVGSIDDVLPMRVFFIPLVCFQRGCVWCVSNVCGPDLPGLHPGSGGQGRSQAQLECLAQQPAGDYQRPTVTNIDSNA